MEIFGIPLQAFLGQLMLGLVNGAFYAMLSLGLAVIFGLLDIVNFAHGALYMVGAFAAWIMLEKWGVSYWWSLLLAPLLVGAFGVLIERAFLKRLYGLDPLYGLLLTFGLSLILEGIFRDQYGVSGQSYPVPEALSGANIAFDGTVEKIDNDLVTLRTTHWYAGSPTDLVTVKGPSQELQQLLVAVDFQDGGRYLVAASNGGRVMVCGFSDEFSPKLQQLYAQAFGQ